MITAITLYFVFKWKIGDDDGPWVPLMLFLTCLGLSIGADNALIQALRRL